MELIKSDIEFKIDGRLYKFSIIHNLQSINDALDSWLVRTKKYTASQLCKYIMSKDESFVAMTEAHYNRLNQPT